MASNRAPRPRRSASLRAAALAVVVAIAPLSVAQRNPFDSGGTAEPWAALKLNPKTRLQLDYRNSSIDAIIAMYQRASGVTIVKDPSLTGNLTLSSAKPVSLNDAFQILATTLKLKGYNLRNEGKLLVIKKADQDAGRPPSNFPTTPDSGSQGGGGDNQTILKVYPINNANASEVARVINSVFADSGSQNFGGFQRQFGDTGSDVDVSAAVQRGGFRGGQGGGNRGGQGGFRLPGATTLVHADYDDYSNQVIVSAPPRFQSQVSDLVRQIDKPTETPTQTKVYHLEYASATEAATVVQSVLNSNVPRGKGGATSAQTSGASGFINALRGQTAGSGTVVAEARTNNIIVTATPENIKTVDEVVKNIDMNVPTESTTFVFPLNNAKADDIAGLLQDAFGTRTGTNGNRNTNRNTTRTNNNRSTGNRNTNNRGLQNEVQGNELALDLKDPNADSGELATSVGVTQGFGQNFLRGGQNNNNNNTQRTFGQTSNGQLVNTRDLSNQVTAIPDANTNSLIVVTSPENAEIIRQILAQLDKIPEQVLIETVIVEASLTASDKLGVTFNSTNTGNTTTNIGSVFNNVGATASTTNDNQGFQYTVTGSDYNIFINALKSDSKFQVLSTPKIFTSNGVEAEINISQSIPYITSSRQDVNGNFTFNYAFQDVGVVLTVTPRITSNGYVSMEVSQTANDLQGYTSFNAPIVNQRQADTTVSVKDGNTVILGGIIRKTVTTDVRKVPVLGDVPILGQLFRSNVKSNAKTELLVFLTPRIVRDADEAQRIRRENEQKLSPDTRRNLDDYFRTGNNDGGQRTPQGDPKTGLPVPDKGKKTPPPVTPPSTNPPKNGG